jgi:hypothetical protein
MNSIANIKEQGGQFIGANFPASFPKSGRGLNPCLIAQVLSRGVNNSYHILLYSLVS